MTFEATCEVTPKLDEDAIVSSKLNRDSHLLDSRGHEYVPSDDYVYKSKQICELVAKPSRQLRHLLGDYPRSSMPAGFSIELSPDPDPEDSIVTQVTKLETSEDTFRLMLIIENFGAKPIGAKVHVLS